VYAGKHDARNNAKIMRRVIRDQQQASAEHLLRTSKITPSFQIAPNTHNVSPCLPLLLLLLTVAPHVAMATENGLASSNDGSNAGIIASCNHLTFTENFASCLQKLYDQADRDIKTACATRVAGQENLSSILETNRGETLIANYKMCVSKAKGKN
jgi:hypothetical protein